MSSSNRSIPTEDRVSALPDSILSHILSFLPTKNSAATTILSKRWKPLWLSVLDLDFDGESFKDFNTFRHVVYSVILSRQFTLPIRSFRFKCCIRHGLYDINDVNRFINAALERRIENLELNMMFWPIDHIKVKLISSIFSCKTLTLLKLKSVILNNLPPQIDLPLLKTLQLDCVRFVSYEEIIKFFQGFPILEELQTSGVYVVPQITMIPGGGRIKHLSNLVRATLSGNIYIHFFLLSAVRILSVKLIWHVYLRLPTFHNLTQMELFFCFYNGRSWSDKWRWMLDVLQHSPKLQHLIIHQEMENGIYQDIWQDPQNVPTCISSQLRTCLFKYCKGMNSELQFAEYVMQNSKVLRTMTIHSACSIDLTAKHQMLRKLAVCPRSCKLIFD